jgi:hypothetical protein
MTWLREREGEGVEEARNCGVIKNHFLVSILYFESCRADGLGIGARSKGKRKLM